MLGLQERLTLFVAVTPVPERDSLLFVLVLVVNVSVAEAAPAAVGAYTTLTWALCPELRVIGNEVPEMANCELVLDAVYETVTLPPEAVMVEASVVVASNVHVTES